MSELVGTAARYAQVCWCETRQVLIDGAVLVAGSRRPRRPLPHAMPNISFERTRGR
jgi:hypothetical protein